MSLQNKKQWFSIDCKKRELRKSLRLYRHYGSNLFKERRGQSEIYYKKAMNISITRFNIEIRNKMKSLKVQIRENFVNYLIAVKKNRK